MTIIFYLYLRGSAVTDEKICVGLLAYINNSDTPIIKVSDRKLKVAKKLVTNKNAYTLFKSYLDGIEKNLETATVSYMEKQSRYQNGIVEMSPPSRISIEDGDAYVDNLFTKHIE